MTSSYLSRAMLRAAREIVPEIIYTLSVTRMNNKSHNCTPSLSQFLLSLMVCFIAGVLYGNGMAWVVSDGSSKRAVNAECVEDLPLNDWFLVPSLQFFLVLLVLAHCEHHVHRHQPYYL